MDPKVAYIHNNKLGKWNYQYLDKDGTIYIGQKDGRLKKKEALDVSLSWGNITGNILNQADLISYINNIIGSGSGSVTSVGLAVPTPASPAFSVSGSPVTSAGTLTINALGTTSDYIRGDGSLAPFPSVPPATTVTGRAGDINVVTSGTNYEVQNAVLPFLLMGC